MLIIFDWDGTLCDSASRIVAAMAAAARECGLAVPAAGATENIIGLGLQESMEALFPARDEACYSQLKALYSSHFLALDQVPSPLFEGALETLEALRARGHRLAVATGKSRRGLDRVLAGHQLGGYFDGSRCADESRSKPHPLMLQQLLQELESSVDDACMIGDTEYDLGMAQAASMTAIGVSYGSHSRQRLRRHDPLAIVDTLPELLDLGIFNSA